MKHTLADKRQYLDEEGNKKEIEDEEEEKLEKNEEPEHKIKTVKPKIKKKVRKTGNITHPPIASQLTPYSIVRDLQTTKADISVGQLLGLVPKLRSELAKGIRKPSGKKAHLADNKNESTKSTALYCDAYVKGVKIPLIVDTGSAGSVVSLKFLQEIDMEIDKPSNIYMININGEKRKPLGMVSNLPIEINGNIIPIDAIVTEATSYCALVGNDWFTKTNAKLNFGTSTMHLQWNGKKLDVPINCTENPHEKEKGKKKQQPIEDSDNEDETEDETEDESEEEYEEEEYFNEKLFCHNEWISSEKAIQIEDEIIEQTKPDQIPIPIKKEFYYQFKEVKKGKFHSGDLNEKQKEQFNNFMKDYNDIFVWNENEFGRTSLERHKIDTGDAAPIKQRFYRTSHKNQAFIEEEINHLLQKRLITPSNSPWSSPVVVVERKNGKLCLCVDYRKLNNVTKKDSYPLPRIDDMLETLSGSQWFSSLDLANGFWQVELDPTTKKRQHSLQNLEYMNLKQCHLDFAIVQ